MEDDLGYEEMLLTCAECGKVVRMIVYSGYDAEGFVCQKCSQGDFSADDESDL